jgi:hypothetical protein
MNMHEEMVSVARRLHKVKGGRGRGYDRVDWLDAQELVLLKHAGQDIEEPEEEEDEHFFEGVSLSMKKETFAPRKVIVKGTEDAEEVYVNEEMS